MLPGRMRALLWLLGTASPAASTQYFSAVPEYTEVNPGAAAALTCSVAEKVRVSSAAVQCI